MPPAVSPDSPFGQFAQRIRELRGRLGMTQQEFADATGVSRAFVSDVENLRSKPGLDLLLGAAMIEVPHGGGFARINRDWLMFGSGEMLEGAGRGLRVGGDLFGRLDMNTLRTVFEAIPKIEEAIGQPIRGRRLREAVAMIYELTQAHRMVGRDEATPDQEHLDALVQSYGLQVVALLRDAPEQA